MADIPLSVIEAMTDAFVDAGDIGQTARIRAMLAAAERKGWNMVPMGTDQMTTAPDYLNSWRVQQAK